MQLLGPALFQVAKLGFEAYESDDYLLLRYGITHNGYDNFLH